MIRTEISPSGHPTEFVQRMGQWLIQAGTSGLIPNQDLDWAERRSAEMSRDYRMVRRIVRQSKP